MGGSCIVCRFVFIFFNKLPPVFVYSFNRFSFIIFQIHCFPEGGENLEPAATLFTIVVVTSPTVEMTCRNIPSGWFLRSSTGFLNGWGGTKHHPLPVSRLKPSPVWYCRFLLVSSIGSLHHNFKVINLCLLCVFLEKFNKFWYNTWKLYSRNQGSVDSNWEHRHRSRGSLRGYLLDRFPHWSSIGGIGRRNHNVILFL